MVDIWVTFHLSNHLGDRNSLIPTPAYLKGYSVTQIFLIVLKNIIDLKGCIWIKGTHGGNETYPLFDNWVTRILDEGNKCER